MSQLARRGETALGQVPKDALPLGETRAYHLGLELAESVRREVDEELVPLLDFHCVRAEYERQLSEALEPYLGATPTPRPYLTLEERSRHLYILGASGMGKSELLRSFIQDDLAHGRGFGLFDPNTALITRVLTDVAHYGYKSDRIIYINPADPQWAVGVNPLELPAEWRDDAHFTDTLAGELYTVFADRWSDSSWGPRMADLLQNALYVLVDARKTLAELPTLLTNSRFRRHCVERTRNVVVVQFWHDEYDPLSDKEKRQWIAPVLNKVRDFLRPTALRAILCQTKSTIDLRRVLDDGQVLLVNLNPAEVGAANASLLGQLLLAKLQAVAFRRRPNSRPWTLYADEFQDFLSVGSAQKFTTMLAQARKFGLNLVLCHQDLAQVRRQDSHLVSSLLTNTEAQIIFSSNHMDAKIMADQIPGGPKDLPDRILVTLARDRWSQGSRHEPQQYMTKVRRTLYNAHGRPLGAEIELETWEKPRSWQQVLAKQPAEKYHRYCYRGRQYERLDQIDLLDDAYVEDGLFGPGALVPLATWLASTNGARFQHIVDGQAVHISCWQFKVEVKTRRVAPDWTQVILGFGPREALLMRRGGQTAILRTPDVPQVTVSDRELAAIETQLHQRWARPRNEVEKDLIRRLDAFRAPTEESSPAAPATAPRTRTVREPKVTQRATCRQCAASQPPGARFCSQCGTDAHDDADDADDTPSLKEGIRRRVSKEPPPEPASRPTPRQSAPFAPQSDDFFEID